MHPWFIAAIALDTAVERQREGERLARLLPVSLPQPHGGARRSLARAAAGVSRASAAVARRLDEHVALTDARRSPSI